MYRMLVILGTDRGNLTLSGTECFHMLTTEGGVNIHKHAVRLVRYGPFWRGDPLPHFQQYLLVLLYR